MKKDSIDELFAGLQGAFDREEPRAGHRDRFLEALDRAQGTVSLPRRRALWQKPLGIAASVAVVAVVALLVFRPGPSLEEQLVRMAPEVGRTEFYFANLIERQVKELEDRKSVV